MKRQRLHSLAVCSQPDTQGEDNQAGSRRRRKGDEPAANLPPNLLKPSGLRNELPFKSNSSITFLLPDFLPILGLHLRKQAGHEDSRGRTRYWNSTCI